MFINRISLKIKLKYKNDFNLVYLTSKLLIIAAFGWNSGNMGKMQNPKYYDFYGLLGYFLC